MKEEWKRLNYRGKDLGDFYLVSNFGEIKGIKTGRIRKKNINHEGYYFVSVSLGSREIKPCIKTHIAVADTFIGYNEELVVNHIDGNKLNNNADNLEFCTSIENTRHAIRLGLFDPKSKEVRCKPIINTKTMEIYDSITDASKAMDSENIEKIRKNISRALNKKSTAYGIKWEYITKPKTQNS